MGFGSGGGFKPGAGDIKGNLTVTAEHPKLIFRASDANGDSMILFKSGDGTQIANFRCDATSNTLNHFVMSAGSGEDDLAISPTGNVGIGTTTFDGTAAGVLTIKNGTSPAALTADQIYIGSKDSAGTGTDTKATLEIWTEEAIDSTALADVATLSKRIPIWHNGVCYWLYLDPV